MQGSVLLILYNVKSFLTSQPFPQYSTAVAFNTKMNAPHIEPDLWRQKSKKTGRHFCRPLCIDYFWTEIQRYILFFTFPHAAHSSHKLNNVNRGLSPLPQTIVRKSNYGMAELAFRSPSKRLSSAVHGADRAARYIQWVGVWNIGLFIFTADKQTNFTVSAVGPVLY